MSKIKNEAGVEFMGEGRYCRILAHQTEAREIIKASGMPDRKARYIAPSRMWEIKNDDALHGRILEAAKRDNAKRIAITAVIPSGKAESLKVGDMFDFPDGKKPIAHMGAPFKVNRAGYDPRISEQGLVGKTAVYLYSETLPELTAKKGEPKVKREMTPEEQAERKRGAELREASREILEASALSGVTLGKVFDFGGDIGEKPVLWVSSPFEAQASETQPRFEQMGLVGKSVAYVYHANPPAKALEEAAKSSPDAALALKIARGEVQPAAPVKAAETKAPADQPAAPAEKVAAPVAKAPEATTKVAPPAPKAEAPVVTAPAASQKAAPEAPKAEAPKAQEPVAPAKAEEPAAPAKTEEAAQAAPDASDMLNDEDLGDLEGLDKSLALPAEAEAEAEPDMSDKFDDM